MPQITPTFGQSAQCSPESGSSLGPRHGSAKRHAVHPLIGRREGIDGNAKSCIDNPDPNRTGTREYDRMSIGAAKVATLRAERGLNLSRRGKG